MAEVLVLVDHVDGEIKKNTYEMLTAARRLGEPSAVVVGKPGTRSPHSYGRSIDINPWENPYHSARGVVPNTWWVSRSHPQVAWRSSGHTVVKLLARYGLRWTYGLSDKHHFDA